MKVNSSILYLRCTSCCWWPGGRKRMMQLLVAQQVQLPPQLLRSLYLYPCSTNNVVYDETLSALTLQCCAVLFVQGPSTVLQSSTVRIRTSIGTRGERGVLSSISSDPIKQKCPAVLHILPTSTIGHGRTIQPTTHSYSIRMVMLRLCQNDKGQH